MKGPSEREIFLAALELPTPEARAAYLEAACGPDVAFHRKVGELLKEHFSNDSLLAGAAVEGDRTLDANPPATEAHPGPIGRYHLLEKIGEGGFGEVWMADQREPVRRRVALKIIKPGMDSRPIVARFEAERQALAMMDHPNIARIFDAGVTDAGRLYFVMELVRGIRITEYCDQNQLPTPERLRLFILVCQAIQHAHQKGIIHRDIKPSNILVTLHDGVPVPKVIDFGIAKATQHDLTDQTVFTQFQQFLGTPAYISPEQAEMSGLDIDTRADIYSLGVLLYELLVGQTPFDGRKMMQGGLDALRQTIREKEPMRPSTRLNTLQGHVRTTAARHRQTDIGRLVHQLAGDLDWIVMKCLEKDRTRRYETANGLAADIQRHLANEPVIARPPSTAYKLRKAWQRNRLVFTAGAAVAAALILGVIGTTIGLLRAEHLRQAAEQKQGEAEAARQRARTEQERAEVQSRKASASEQQSRRLRYASDMSLAQQSLKLNNLGRARRLLDRNRPGDGEEDLRGWEWRHLWQLTRSSALVTLTNRATPGISVSFSPDGTQLAVSWRGGRVELWDVPGRRFDRVLSEGANRFPGRLAFSPVRNLLAAASEPRAVALLDTDSGRSSILWRAPDRRDWYVRDLAFSPDGSRVVLCAGVSSDDPTSPPSERDTGIWVVNVDTAQVEHLIPAPRRNTFEHGAGARLSPDNRRLYLARYDTLNGPYSVVCLELDTGRELWRADPERDQGLTTLALSPDGSLLASGSGFENSTIRVREAATGRLLHQLEGHTAWVSHLAFTRDGRRLISAGSDQSIRLWDATTGTATQVLHGHTDEVHAVAASDPQHLFASVSKDGDLLLWRDDERHPGEGRQRLPETLGITDVQMLDHSRALLLPPGQPPEVVDLQGHAPPRPLPGVANSTHILGCFGTNLLCQWDEAGRILVRELRDRELVTRHAITPRSGRRPAGLRYNPARELLAWTEDPTSKSVHVASFASPPRRLELTSDVAGMRYFLFSADGTYLAGVPKEMDSLRIWRVETGDIVGSKDEPVSVGAFAAGGRVFVSVTNPRGEGAIDHEVLFHDLARPDRSPLRIPGRFSADALAASPDGELVASVTVGGLLRLFDPRRAALVESVHGHLNGAHGVSFSPDGRRLITTSGGREAVKLWDVGTRQEMLTLEGIGGSLSAARWSADGNVILAGAPWQAWTAPSWEEIRSEEAREAAESPPALNRTHLP